MPSRARAEEAVAAAEAAQGDLVAESPSDPLLLNDFVLSARYGRAGGYYARAVERARRACSLAPARDEFKLTLAESLTSLGHFSGSARGSVTTIVSPRTFARWLAGEKKRPKRAAASRVGPERKNRFAISCCGRRSRPVGNIRESSAI